MLRESTSGEPTSKTEERIGSKSSKKSKLDERTSYLIEESKPAKTYKLFAREIKSGRKGLCITRKNPKPLRDKYGWGAKDLPIIWLTNNNIQNEHCIDPTNLSRLSIEIVNFIKDYDNGTIMLEGLEYLISQNSYQFILRFVQLINDKVMLSNCTFLVPIDPLILTEREVHLLERDMTVYGE